VVMGSAGGVDHRHVSVRRSTAPSAADRIDRIARLENLRATTAALPAAESVRFLPHRTIQDHHHHTHQPPLLSRAPQTTMRSLAIRSSRNVYRIDQDPAFLRIDADILRP
jgi:hypothetical protein